MDSYKDSNIVEEIIPIKKKNKSKKSLNKQIKCKEIPTKKECELRTDCKFSKKTLKCRKKIQSNLELSIIEEDMKIFNPIVVRDGVFESDNIMSSLGSIPSQLSQDLKKENLGEKEKPNTEILYQENKEIPISKQKTPLEILDKKSQSNYENKMKNSIKEKIIVDPCEEKRVLENKLKELNKEKLQLGEDCNKKKYENMEFWHDKKLMDLIIYIFNNKIETCQQLFELFPESNERTKGYLPKPYIFEALWKIIFLLK